MKNLSRIKNFSHTVLIWFVIAIHSVFLPLSITTPFISAQETTTDPISEVTTTPITEIQTTTTTDTTGPQEPTGAENRSYTYNDDTKLWENDYYTWDPVTRLTAPKTETNYSYNPETGRWDTTKWVYAPETGTYKPQTTTQTVPNQVQQTVEPASETPDNKLQPSTATNPLQTEKSTAKLLNNTDAINGPGSLSVTNYDSSNKGYFDNFFNANISVSVNSKAISGDASVLQNTIGGSALTGDASAIATIMNLVQSAWGLGGLMPYLYTENIQGDYFGDIFLDPSLIKVQSASTSNNLVVNSTQDVAIVNEIELLAQSGNALVQSNTQAGNATSGDATAILNLINVINSSMAVGQSFIGMLNIFGNLEGDVLLPDNLIDSLIASNIPTTDIQLPNNLESSLTLNNSNEQTINNDISATASSGNASVISNTSAGNAQSGDASTNVTVFNLTGSHIMADQALLVFVQVMGKWVGFITNAPSGSNVALLGGSVTANQKIYDAEINSNNTSLIDNNVNVSAATGDASVLQNTTAGDATSGNANAVANITNITNSSISLSNWFGLLFINIFGDWNGSFGTNTPFGSILAATTSTPFNNAIPPQTVTNTSNVSYLGAEPSNANVRVFAVSLDANSSGGTSVTSATPEMEEDVPPPAVESEDSSAVAGAFTNYQDKSTPTSTGYTSLYLTTILFGLIGFGVYKRLQV